MDKPLDELWQGLSGIQRADIEAHIRGLKPGPETYPTPQHGWTCFHCGETFKTALGASLHFGKPKDKPTCQY